MAPSSITSQPSDAPPALWALWGVLAAIILPELILLASDYGLIGSRRWRSLAYGYGAFWAGLTGGWVANYPGQGWVMFLSYSLLHAGPGHLLGNVAALIWLGPVAIIRVGTRGFLQIYGASTLGGALVFAALSTSFSPMVGASGAIFGLAGAWVAWRVMDQPTLTAAIRYGVGMFVLLVVANAAIWIMENGQLAWETHLGGFVIGALLAAVLPRHTA